MSIRLRELIRQVRACKTAADERAVVAKESAAIRTAFKEENGFRHRNVAKLLFIHMLGYATHFGHVECLKLVASDKYPEKRIGYLGLMLLLDENQEVLMLVTNSMKQDLNHHSKFIAGLSLCAIANIASPDMARDLSGEVKQLMSAKDPYIRKKAALTAVRVMRKVPDLVDLYVSPIKELVKHGSHGTLLPALSAMLEACTQSGEARRHFRKMTPLLLEGLKSLTSSNNYSAEHDISGINNPFLQVKYLQVLRLLGKGNEKVANAVSDALPPIVINTDTSKTAGYAIVYECVLTIMAIDAASDLRVLAFNVLGRFLLNRDNNIRYVALNTLAKVVRVDTAAVQRHRATIVDCLKDPDISIRKRALELVYLLINEANIKVLVRELLNYLVRADAEFKPDLTGKVCTAVQRFSPSRQWHVDTMVRVLAMAGTYAPERVNADFIDLIQRTPELQGYAVRRLYMALSDSLLQERLVHIGVWCMGEFGEYLVNGAGMLDDEEPIHVSEEDVLTLLRQVNKMSHSHTTREYMLNALIKLVRVFSPTGQERIKGMLATFRGHFHVELQQRACEYSSLFAMGGIRNAIVDSMPAMERDDDDDDGDSTAASTPVVDVGGAQPAAVTAAAMPAAAASGGGNLLDDLMGLDSGAPAAAASPVAASPASGGGGGGGGGGGLLDDLLGGMPMGAPAMAAAPAAAPATGGGDLLMDMLGGGGGGGAAPVAAAAPAGGGAGALGDLMGLMGGMPAATAAAAPAAQPAALMGGGVGTGVGVGMGMGMPGGMGGGAGPVLGAGAAAAQTFPPMVAFQKAGLSIHFAFQKNTQNAALTAVNVTFSNANPLPLDKFMFQVAVPKYLKLQMNPATSNTIPAASQGQVSQIVRLANSAHGEKPILMRLRIEYTLNGQKVAEQAQVANFPAGL